jgi:hypothetical protein
MYKWLTIDWYKYLFEKPSYEAKMYCGWIGRIICRIKGHKLTWFIVHGLDPDMTCKNCGDDLG